MKFTKIEIIDSFTDLKRGGVKLTTPVDYANENLPKGKNESFITEKSLYEDYELNKYRGKLTPLGVASLSNLKNAEVIIIRAAYVNKHVIRKEVMPTCYIDSNTELTLSKLLYLANVPEYHISLKSPDTANPYRVFVFLGFKSIFYARLFYDLIPSKLKPYYFSIGTTGAFSTITTDKLDIEFNGDLGSSHKLVDDYVSELRKQENEHRKNIHLSRSKAADGSFYRSQYSIFYLGGPPDGVIGEL